MCWVSAASFGRAEAPQRPNVLVMVADDLGWADLGLQGCKDIEVPDIDSIGRDGAVFSNSYVSAPVCSPSRAGLMTGRYQTRFGHELNHPQADRGPVGLPVEEKLWPAYFREAGYVTGHAGKWHLGNTEIPEFTPNARGFDESYHFAGAKKLPRPKLPYRYNGKPVFSDEIYVDLGIAERASAFIEAQEKPWFLYTAFITPHEPMDLPQGVAEQFADITDPKRRKFLGAMSLLDQAVGRILQTLKRSRQAENTLVIFFSDNGAPTGNGSSNAPFQGSKSTLWEGGIRSMFLVRWPEKIPPGRRIETPVTSLDLLPTALAAANIPTSAEHRLDGKNLLPILKGTESQDAIHEHLFWRYGDQWAVRQRNWKLVSAGKGEEERTVKLIDLSSDPGETKDLSKQHPELASKLLAAWQSWNEQNVPPLWGEEVR